jgi:hypothetical protein
MPFDTEHDDIADMQDDGRLSFKNFLSNQETKEDRRKRVYRANKTYTNSLPKSPEILQKNPAPLANNSLKPKSDIRTQQPPTISQEEPEISRQTTKKVLQPQYGNGTPMGMQYDKIALNNPVDKQDVYEKLASYTSHATSFIPYNTTKNILDGVRALQDEFEKNKRLGNKRRIEVEHLYSEFERLYGFLPDSLEGLEVMTRFGYNHGSSLSQWNVLRKAIKHYVYKSPSN